MRRMQLVELEDLPWFPAVLRDGGTAYIGMVVKKSGHAAMLVPTIEKALEATGSTEILDLCSGGGGPVRVVADELAARGKPVKVTLSDKYPNLPAFAYAAEGTDGRIQGRSESTDATAVPSDIRAFRTMFNCFHHFPPDAARAILADAVAKRQPIGVFEVVSREALPLIGLLLSPLPVTLSLPLWRPFRWSWIFFTWILPLMQPFVLWDGIVSWLRIYSVEELRELVAGIDAPDWEWDIGLIKLGNAPAHATYLVGRPR